MRHRCVSRTLVVIATSALALSGVSGWAQGRGRGTAPAVPGTPPEVTAIRAGRPFDAKTGTILTNQVVIVTGGRITDGGEGLTSCIAAGVDIPMHGPEMTDAQLQMIVQKRLMLGITIDDLINLDPGDKKITGGKVSRFTLTEGVFKRAHAAGVPLPFGSGRGSAGEGIMSVGGEASQFSWMTKWGMTPAEALQTAFMVAADSLNYKWGSQIGSVEKGKYADIIAVSGNPLTDVTEMERVKFVMKGGEVIRSDIGRPAASLSTGR